MYRLVQLGITLLTSGETFTMDKTQMRHVLMHVLVLISSSMTFSLSSAASIACSLAKDDVEKTICSHPSLTAQDKAISDRLDSLERACPSLRMLLIQGQKFWLRERWDCRNVEGVFEKPDGLATCLASQMEQRLLRLNDVPEKCNPTPLIGGYRFVDPGYLGRFSNHYIGRTVSVFGSMDLESCRTSGTASTTATIVGNSSRHERFRVIFSAMPEGEREFLCAQHPAAHWKGVVKKDAQGSYLFLSDVLGNPLR